MNKCSILQKKEVRKKIFYVLASIVVFITSYALVLPAITVDEQTAFEDPAISNETLNEELINELETVADPFVIEAEREATLNNHSSEETIEETGGDVADTLKESTIIDNKAEALNFIDESNNVKVYVEAPLEAFPEGTTMIVTPISADEVEDEVNNTLEDKVKRIEAVDITFYDKDGNEVEPACEIKVSLKSDLIKDSKDTTIIHIDDEGNGTVVEQSDEATKDDEVKFESKDFSTYVIVVTTEVITADGDEYTISVTYDSDLLPENVSLAAEELIEGEAYEAYKAVIEEELGIELNYVRLFDITILDDNGNEVQPGDSVKVTIRLNDLDEEREMTAIHIPDDGDMEVIDEVKVETVEENGKTATEVSFDAEGFSVYAVVGNGEITDESRVEVNFYGKDTDNPIATVYVKNSDTVQEIEEIVYDPGCGELDNNKKELFDGWIISTIDTTDGSQYSIETEGKTIEEIREYLAGLEIKEGNVLNIYAKIVRTITVSYQGEAENILLGTENIKVLGSDDPSDPNNIADYTISMNYTPESSTQAFMGWNVAEGANNILSASFEGEDVEAPYLNGTELSIKGDIKLSVNAPRGHWLVFDENGKGATYNAPRFIKDGQTTVAPSIEMERLGYYFSGWYELKEDVDISNVPKDSNGNYIVTDEYFKSFTFGNELENNITIYAKWTSTTTANYTVIVWKERMSDTYANNGGTGEGKIKNYDFAESYTFSGTVGSVATAVSNGTTSVVDGDPNNTRYFNARIRGTDVDGTNVDKTVSFTGYHCAGYDTDVEIKPEGTSVVNVYYDRNTVTYTFYTYGSSSSTGTWYLCKENGSNIIASGSYATSSKRISIRNSCGTYV